MQVELKVAIIASIATFIVALINVIVSWNISRRQNSLELKKTRIELLENRRISVEKVRTELNKQILDIQNADISNPNQMIPKLVDNFQAKSTLFLSIGHFFPEDLNNKVNQLRDEIDENIIKSRKNIPISLSEVKRISDEMSKFDSEMQAAISKKLRDIENQIEGLLS
ncbi:MAG TPA: hypothetical protein VFT78_08660 [Hanamia sp.]|nr:hypothetical protein [Hanamia sp.]